MALAKQSLNINFAQGIDTKTDPKQLPIGRFLSLNNAIFDQGGLLQKRNGFAALTTLGNTTSSYLTTLNDNLLAIGSSVQAYNSNASTWVSKGSYQPLEMATSALVRNGNNQTQVDTAIASNGLLCAVYTEVNTAGTTSYYYVVSNSETGQNIVSPTAIPAGSGTVTGSARVFCVGNYFVIVFTNVISATSHLQYVAINVTNPTQVTAAADIASSYVSATTLSWDGAVLGSFGLFIAYNTASGGQAIKVTTLTPTLNLLAAKTYAGSIATMVSVAVDVVAQNVVVSYYDSASQTGYTLVVDANLDPMVSPQSMISSLAILNLTSVAYNGQAMIYYEVQNNYSYDSSIPSHYIASRWIQTVGVVLLGSARTTYRSVGIGSKAFVVNGTPYLLASYQSTFQNTYFLIGSQFSANPVSSIVGKLAYENGGGYLTAGLPSVSVSGNTAEVAYLYKDLIEPLATTNTPQQTTTGGVYSQTGINLATFTFGTTASIDSAEIGSTLHLSGGFLWMYDGTTLCEHNFFLWPSSVEASWSATGGHMAPQPDGSTNTNAYYYQVIYEWTDNAGNIHRSAPSVPVAVTTTGTGNTGTGSVTINVPTLRLTMKSNVSISIYRWSVQNQSYYLVTRQANSTSTDSISYVDTAPDVTVGGNTGIVGNALIYTTGGVVEDVNAPASNIMTLFDTRLWLVDAEDPNLLWFSKQVIEATPVEMSDLFTFYVAPTTGVQGSTGAITALAPMDDKLIIFKENAIYYINGIGPDNTGANNGYSQPIFITSTVGCSNQNSIIFQPNGLMFQSSKGIWLLGRDLSTKYIGAEVEAYNSSTVESAVAIPSTNQVRFTLNSGTTLMYDYYYGQWATFTNIPALSSCIFQNLHTFLNSSGAVYQESPGTYLDGSSPVLLSFTTGWINLAGGISGYERFYDLILTGQYFSPHKLVVSIGYDYSPMALQQVVISPNNYNAPWGGSSAWGSASAWGGNSTLEQWRIHTQQQTCQAFQVSVSEVFDASYGVTAGVGLTLSNMNLRVGLKKSARPIKAANTAG